MSTKTLKEQKAVEKTISDIFSRMSRSKAFESLILKREKHVRYLLKGLNQLPRGFVSLDASRPWLCYWILHSLSLLGTDVSRQLATRCIDTLKRCQHPTGGFGGGPGQMPHLATTYAAVCALVTVGGFEALEAINRKTVLQFLLRMKNPDGSFCMHEDGEVDVRGCYTALAVAKLLNITNAELVSNVGQFVRSCQTFEGGIAGSPQMEAHGGLKTYTYCGLAAAMLAGQEEDLDLPLLLDWAVSRQRSIEGGFQGRTNKLVDGCYSFWQGGLFALLQKATPNLIGQLIIQRVSNVEVKGGTLVEGCVPDPVEVGEEDMSAYPHFLDKHADGSMVNSVSLLFSSRSLQGYILLCCQNDEGGLIDKPGVQRDYYHTCYCLSGLSAAQYTSSVYPQPPKPKDVLGPYENLLEATEPLCNVRMDRYMEATEYFFSQGQLKG